MSGNPFFVVCRHAPIFSGIVPIFWDTFSVRCVRNESVTFSSGIGSVFRGRVSVQYEIASFRSKIISLRSDLVFVFRDTVSVQS